MRVKIALLLVLAPFSLQPLWAQSSTTLSIGETRLLVCPNPPNSQQAIYNSAWGSNCSGISIIAHDEYSCTIKVTSFFSGIGQVQCDYYYMWYIGTRMYTNHATTYYSFTCEKVDLSVSPTELTLDPGDTYTLKCKFSPAISPSPGLTWSTSNSKVATVRDGVVRAIGSGLATVTVSSEAGANNAECRVTVNTIEPSSITIQDNRSIEYKSGVQLSYSLFPTAATVRTVEWKSEDESIVKVSSSGFLTGVNVGTTRVQAIVNGSVYSNWCSVTVTEPPFLLKETSVKDQAFGVPLLPTFFFEYSIPIFEGTDFTGISLTNASSGTKTPSSISINNNKLYIKPSSNLNTYSNYILYIPSNAIKNQWNTYYSTDLSIRFKTEIFNNCLNIWMKDGSKVAFSLDEKPIISTNDNMLNVKTSEIEIEYPFERIHKFTLNVEDSPSPIREDKAEKCHLSLLEGYLFVSHAIPQSNVMIYTIEGKMVGSYRILDNGTLQIPLSNLPRGVNLVRMGNINYKILIRK